MQERNCPDTSSYSAEFQTTARELGYKANASPPMGGLNLQGEAASRSTS